MIIDSVHYSTIMAMKEDQLENELLSYLNQHIKAVRGDIHQDPYKTDLFLIFKSFHKKKRVPKHFSDIIKKIRSRIDSTDTQRYEEILTQAQVMWEEWIYVWELL